MIFQVQPESFHDEGDAAAAAAFNLAAAVALGIGNDLERDGTRAGWC